MNEYADTWTDREVDRYKFTHTHIDTYMHTHTHIP